MNIQFTDRKTFIENIPLMQNPRYALISVSSTWGDYHKMRRALKDKVEGKRASCYIFADIEREESGFTDKEADHIFKTVNRWDNLPYPERPINFVVHCDMGVSRSGAIAKWVNDYYGLDNRMLNEYTIYNKFVYQMLMRATGTDLKTWYENQQGE